MKEAQFILWLQGFLEGKMSLGPTDIATIKNTLSRVKFSNNPYSNTNESFPGSGKQMLHD